MAAMPCKTFGRKQLRCIRPTLIVILLLNVGRILRGDFQMFYQIIGMNGQLFDATDVIDAYVFRALISGGDVGMTAAATLYQSVLCFLIIVTVNAIVKKSNPTTRCFNGRRGDHEHSPFP